MKIKIKVKNIILISLVALFVVLIVVPFGTLEIAKYLDRKGSDKAQVFYESYHSKAIKLQDEEALYNYAVNLMGHPYRYTIMMQGHGGTGDKTTLENMEKAKTALEKILDKKPKGDYNKEFYYDAYIKLMDISISTQGPKELLSWIKWGSSLEDDRINYISDLYNAYYHFVNRDYTMSEEILDMYEGVENIDDSYYFLRGYIALFKDDFDEAKDYFEKGNHMGVNKHDDTLFGTASHQNRLFWIEEYMTNQMGENKISGKVTYDGEPMPFVEVYIQENYGGYRSSGLEFIGITDINGNYETIGIREGSYDIGIGLSDSILYDKVFLTTNSRNIDIEEDTNYDFTFASPIKVKKPFPGTVQKDDEFKVEWDKVEGAAFYDIQTIAFENQDKNSGSSHRFSIMDDSIYGKLTENEIVMDLNKIRKKTGSFMWSGEEMLVNPGSILGSFIKGYEYPIVVNAYDENKNLIGSSLPINSYYDNMPSIKLEGELSEGEKLISNTQYEKAIEYYNEVLKDDPSNEEALLYLTKIYYISYKKDMADYDKAMEYAIRYKDLYDDSSLIFNVIRFMDHESHRRYEDLIKKEIKNIDELNPEIYYYDIGRFYLSLKDYEKAKEVYEEFDIDSELFFIYLYLGQLNMAIERLETDGSNVYNMDKIILKKAIRGLSEEDVLSADYNILKSVIESMLSEDISHPEGKSLYDKSIVGITNPNINLIMEELKLYNNWDMDMDY